MLNKLGILFCASEVVPFVKTGGLADVAGALPLYIKKGDCDIRVILPKYGTIADKYKSTMEHVDNFYIKIGWRDQYCGIETLEYNGIKYYFVDNEYYFYRNSPYGFYDDGERMAFFSMACVEAIRHLPDFHCDVLHCNDWHTSLSPVFLREFYRNEPGYDSIRTIMTVHNLKFQGQYSNTMLSDVLSLNNVLAAKEQLTYDSESINFMQGGLSYSDALTTVSPTYSQEIQSAFYGEGLDYIFRERASILEGILNGIDTDIFNPKTDRYIIKNFDKNNMDGKMECKKSIQQEFGFDEKPFSPLIIMIGRLTDQKGIQLLLGVFHQLMERGIQIIVLGTGDSKYENAFNSLAWQYPKQFSAQIRFDEALSHRLYAGADMLLMPSLFEPCGLSQMIAMQYGTLPIVRETGGLKDSVQPYNQFTGEGTGFSFCNFNAHEMMYTIFNACELYWNNRKTYNHLIRQAMEKDFTWSNSANQYIDLYKRICPWRVEEINRLKAEKIESNKKKAKLKKENDISLKQTAVKKSVEKKSPTKNDSKKTSVKIAKKLDLKPKNATYKSKISESNITTKQNAVNERIKQISTRSKKK